MTLGTGDVLEGRYELLEPLGRGGMGSVYRAVDERLGREVAVKVLDGAYATDPQFLARFRREARAAASLSHPAVVGVLDRGEQGAAHFIVMELIDGPTLADVLRAEGPLDPGHVLAIGAVLADALGAAHRLGLVHRDVKPSNVLITPDGRVKLTDFGIARAVTDTTLASADDVFGSVPYVAPEQVRGDVATPASDVYALGCLLYALLTGEPPFRAEAAASVLHQHVNADADPPSAHNEAVPSYVDEVVLRLLAKDPLDRLMDGNRAAVVLRHAAGRTADVDASFPPEIVDRTIRMEVADTATRLLDTDRTRLVATDEADVAPDDGPMRWGVRLAFLVGLVVVIVLVALFGERWTGAAGAPDPPPSPAPAAEPAADPSPEPTAEPSPEPTPDTVDDVIGQISGMLTAGRGAAMSNDAADKLAERLFKVVQEFGDQDWDAARSRTEDLREELQRREDKGQVTTAAATDLRRAIDRLAALLPAGED